MSIKLEDAKALIILACKATGYYSPAAVNLLLGTMLRESAGVSVFQQTQGAPTSKSGFGLFQMEPATHDDCWANFINNRPDLYKRMVRLSGNAGANAMRLSFDFVYAAAMCRVRYLRDPNPLPSETDAVSLATYWKDVYNTSKGKGTVDGGTVALFQKAVSVVPTDLSLILDGYVRTADA